MADLLPLFLNLTGRAVLLVGGGRVATAKLQQLLAAGARVRVVAPEISEEILGTTPHVQVAQRPFVPADLDGVWLVVAAATPPVNREVAAVAETQRVFVNAVDDPANASAFLSGVVRRLAAARSCAVGVAGARRARGLASRRRADGRAQAAAAARAERVVSGNRRGRACRTRRRRPLRGRSCRACALAEPPGGLVAVNGVGHVSLVGAGPGDPGLLTRRAIARLRAADLVLYDALIDNRILKYARRAQRFFVGKRAGRHAMAQTAIHRLMIRAARRGRHVVRLKGGDPFVFGRGGEEALAL